MSQFIEMFGYKSPNAKMSSVSTIVSGKSIPKDLEDTKGPLAYVKVADFNIDGNEKCITTSSRFVTTDNAKLSVCIPVGSVIFAKNGAASLSNKKRITVIECCIDMNTMAIIPKDNILSEFLYSIVCSIDISRYVRQGAIPSISPKSIENICFYLPPIEEQERFVCMVEQADKSKFGDFKSQFIEMFGNCKSQGTLSSLCATFIDGDWIESKDQSDNGIRLIQTGNVGFGFFKGREDKSRYITEETFKKLNCTEVVPGDILISRLPDPIGRACIVPEGIGKAITAVDCTIVRLNATLLPEFLISFSKTALYASQINKIKTGTTRLRVSRGNLGNVIIPIPPIESQHHFAAIAQQADKSKSVIQKALVYLNDIQSDELGKIA